MPNLVLVVGSGRSGTSLLAGLLRRLGFVVPEPEVPPDATNPRGFAEPLWAVRFHNRLLRDERLLEPADRPQAWARMAEIGLEPASREELGAWLAAQLRTGDDVVIKDPRLSFFLPLWRECARDVGVLPRFVTMLRHPAAVVDSKLRWYGDGEGARERTVGWLDQTLFTELATREDRRAFVRYEDLLADCTGTIRTMTTALGLPLPSSLSALEGAVDRSLNRSRTGWERHGLLRPLEDLAESVWQQVVALAGDPYTGAHGLDALRGEFVELHTAGRL